MISASWVDGGRTSVSPDETKAPKARAARHNRKWLVLTWYDGFAADGSKHAVRNRKQQEAYGKTVPAERHHRVRWMTKRSSHAVMRK